MYLYTFFFHQSVKSAYRQERASILIQVSYTAIPAGIYMYIHVHESEQGKWSHSMYMYIPSNVCRVYMLSAIFSVH